MDEKVPISDETFPYLQDEAIFQVLKDIEFGLETVYPRTDPPDGSSGSIWFKTLSGWNFLVKEEDGKWGGIEYIIRGEIGEIDLTDSNAYKLYPLTRGYRPDDEVAHGIWSFRGLHKDQM